MRNSEILSAPKDKLVGIDRQRRYLLEINSVSARCPNPGCSRSVNVFQAAGIDIDDYDFGGSGSADPKYTCPHCHYALAKIVPLVQQGRPYYWVLNEPLPRKD